MSAANPGEIALNIMHLDGADRGFDALVAGLIEKLRAAMGVNKPAFDMTASDDMDPLVEAEFEAVRQRLGRFRGEYEEIYAALLLKYISPEQLTAVRTALASAPMQHYFHALGIMRPELTRELEALFWRMGQTPLHEELSSPSDARSGAGAECLLAAQPAP